MAQNKSTQPTDDDGMPYGAIILSRVVDPPVYEPRFAGNGLSCPAVDMVIPILAIDYNLTIKLYCQEDLKTGKPKPNWNVNTKVLKPSSDAGKALLTEHINMAINSWSGWPEAWKAAITAIDRYKRSGGSSRDTKRSAIMLPGEASVPIVGKPAAQPRHVKRASGRPERSIVVPVAETTVQHNATETV